jgi:hypothetical protein
MLRRAFAKPAALLAVALVVSGVLFGAGPSIGPTCQPPAEAALVRPPELPVRTPYDVENGVLVVGDVVARERDLRGREWARRFLWRTTFDHCDLRRADLVGSEFWACDLRGARLEGANLKGCVYDCLTRWPAGFRPGKHGARLVE